MFGTEDMPSQKFDYADKLVFTAAENYEQIIFPDNFKVFFKYRKKNIYTLP